MIPKFRAWDKEQKCWIKVAALNFDEDGEMWYLAPAMDGFNPVYYENELGKTWELMQSTGLKDKNGVEIFEGDIVKIIGDVLDDDMSVIRFTEGGFYLDYKNLDTEFELLYSIDLPIEIIGNIYEDKELLEVEG